MRIWSTRLGDSSIAVGGGEEVFLDAAGRELSRRASSYQEQLDRLPGSYEVLTVRY